MNARSLGATKVFAWPHAEIAGMGAVAAVRIRHRRKLAEVAPELRPQMERERAAEQEKVAGSLTRARESGDVEDIVEPDETRAALAGAIMQTSHNRDAHGNIPL